MFGHTSEKWQMEVKPTLLQALQDCFLGERLREGPGGFLVSLSFQQRLFPGSDRFAVAPGAGLEWQSLAAANLTTQPRAATWGWGNVYSKTKSKQAPERELSSFRSESCVCSAGPGERTVKLLSCSQPLLKWVPF